MHIIWPVVPKRRCVPHCLRIYNPAVTVTASIGTVSWSLTDGLLNPGRKLRLLHVLPNTLTILRLCAGIAYPFVPVGWRIPLLVYAAVSDLIDGPLSRLNHSTTNFGQVWDPIADKVCVLAVLITAVVDGQIVWWELLLVGARDLMVIGLAVATFLIDRSKLKDMPPRISGKVATGGQFAFLVGVLAFDVKPPWLFWTAVAVSVWSGIDYTYYGIRRAIREVPAKRAGGAVDEAG